MFIFFPAFSVGGHWKQWVSTQADVRWVLVVRLSVVLPDSRGVERFLCAGCYGVWPAALQQMNGRDKAMMLRFGTISSLQHLQKNPGQAARGVCCVWKNDFQMAVIRFQGEGSRRSRDVSVNSSQQLQSKVWGKRRPAHWFVFPFDWFLYFLILCVLSHSPLFQRLDVIFYLSFKHPCFHCLQVTRSAPVI